MIYYVALYFIRKYAINRLGTVMAVTGVACVIWYLLMERPDGYNMYGHTYFKWGHYFLFMLLGAMMGLKQQTIQRDAKGLKSLGMLGVSFVVYYAVLFSGRKWDVMEELQIVSLVPLLAVTYYFYKVCNCDFAYRCYRSKVLRWFMKLVGGLCLEIYLVQASLFTDKMNAIFPLNLLIMFVIIVVMAYILRCLSRVFSQTFKDMDYNWKEVFKMV